VLLLAITSLALAPAHGRVLDVEVTSRRDVMGGQLFGTTGAYEALRGRVHFAVAVANPHNARIVDLAQAANLKNGEVEFWADFFVLRPKDPARGNGALLLEVPNRGDVGITRIVDGGDALHEQDAGDGWLMRHGYAFASIGWQWDATGQGALKLQAPIARPASGRITGLLRGDVMLPRATEDLPLGHLMRGNIGGSEYPVAEPDDPRNTLSVRDSRDAPRTIIPRSQWEFEHDVGNKLLPSDRFIHLTGGFKPGKIYEYVYVVADPVIAGLGFAAVRDFASYAKHAPEGIVSVKRVYGEGISQNGRFLRNFLYDGFNADEEGRMALDGVLAHVAGAGRGSFNYRFAQPSRDAQPTSSVGFPTDLFPFTDEPETDPVTGVKAGLLDRASAEHVEPKIFFSNTSYEYWSRAASLIHTSPDATRDVEIGANVRIYHYTGLQHFTGAFPPAKGTGDLAGQQPESPLPIRYFWRSMIENLDAWVRAGTAPPASVYPRLDNGTLVPFARYAFPKIPGVATPHEASVAWHLDFGPDWQSGVLTLQPPTVGAAFPVLVPQVDADGNERGGVNLPEISVPLATYTGWNLRDPSIGAPTERVAFEGSFIPFAHTQAERVKSGDPRKSIAERYASHEDYSARVKSAVAELVRERFILEDDRNSLINIAEKDWEFAAGTSH